MSIRKVRLQSRSLCVPLPATIPGGGRDVGRYCLHAGQEGRFLTANRRLRDADQLLGPAVERMVEALGAPDADAALVALVRRQAAVIDGMPDGVAVALLPQHSGQLVKALAELQARAAARGQAADTRPSKLDQLRAARASGRRPDFL
jgi:hypothetical protein